MLDKHESNVNLNLQCDFMKKRIDFHLEVRKLSEQDEIVINSINTETLNKTKQEIEQITHKMKVEEHLAEEELQKKEHEI